MLRFIKGVHFPLRLVAVFLLFRTIRLKNFVRPNQKRKNYKKCDVKQCATPRALQSCVAIVFWLTVRVASQSICERGVKNAPTFPKLQMRLWSPRFAAFHCASMFLLLFRRHYFTRVSEKLPNLVGAEDFETRPKSGRPPCHSLFITMRTSWLVSGSPCADRLNNISLLRVTERRTWGKEREGRVGRWGGTENQHNQEPNCAS